MRGLWGGTGRFGNLNSLPLLHPDSEFRFSVLNNPEYLVGTFGSDRRAPLHNSSNNSDVCRRISSQHTQVQIRQYGANASDDNLTDAGRDLLYRLIFFPRTVVAPLV
jgi:hypothetical protein